MKPYFMAIAVLCLISVVHVNSQEAGASAEYQEWVNAFEPATADSLSMKQLLEVSKKASQDQTTLAHIENWMNGFEDTLTDDNPSTPFQHLALTKARILIRLENNQEARTIFDQAARAQWQVNPFLAWNAALQETGQYALLAIEECKRCLPGNYPAEVRQRYGLTSSMSVLLVRLIECKNQQYAVGKSVYFPLVIEYQDKGYSETLNIVKALCDYLDGRVQQAIQTMQDLMQEYQGPKEGVDEERWRFLPLLASIVYFGTGETESAEQWMAIYIDRNQENPDVMLRRMLEIMYAMEHNSSYIGTVRTVCSAMIREIEMSATPKDEGFLNPLASLFDTYANSLFKTGERDRAYIIWQDVYDNYRQYNHVAGYNALLNSARINMLFRNKNNLALSQLNKIVSECDNQWIIDQAKILKKNFE